MAVLKGLKQQGNALQGKGFLEKKRDAKLFKENPKLYWQKYWKEKKAQKDLQKMKKRQQ